MKVQEIRDLVSSARVARLATVDAAGRPHLVPICFVLLGDTLYSAVDHKPKRGAKLRRIANIEATRHTSVLIDEYHEDWSRLWWIRLDGHGRIVADPADVDRAVTALTRKYQQYASNRPSGPVIAIDIDRWSGWRTDLGQMSR